MTGAWPGAAGSAPARPRVQRDLATLGLHAAADDEFLPQDVPLDRLLGKRVLRLPRRIGERHDPVERAQPDPDPVGGELGAFKRVVGLRAPLQGQIGQAPEIVRVGEGPFPPSSPA